MPSSSVFIELMLHTIYGPLCKNAKNSFVSVINNILFNRSIISNNNLENIIEFPTELKNYENECYSNIKNIDYNLETNFDNIFYDINDCSIIKGEE